MIQQADTPLATYNHPVNRFVAGFIGMPPMNFFDGAIRIVDGQMVFEEGKLRRAAVPWPATDDQTRREPVVMVGELTLPGNGFTLPGSAALCASGWRARSAGTWCWGFVPEHLHLRPDRTARRDCWPMDGDS